MQLNGGSYFSLIYETVNLHKQERKEEDRSIANVIFSDSNIVILDSNSCFNLKFFAFLIA